MIAFAFVYAWVLVVSQGEPPLSSGEEPIGGDYVAFYAAGRVILNGDGGHLYDKPTLVAIQDQALAGRIPNFYDAFRNPPFLALVFAPLATLPLLPSFAVWSMVSVVCLVVALRTLCSLVPGMERRWRGLTLIAFAFGPVYFGLIDGQNSTVSLLLGVLIYRALLRGEDRTAGVLAALGLFKPQLFVVFPLVFLAARRWRSVLAYGVTALVLALISLAVVGIDGAIAWVRILVDMETVNASRNAWRMHSLKTFFDLLLPGQTLLAWTIYGLASVGLVAMLARVWSLAGSVSPTLWILTSLVTVLIDPHLVDYDLAFLIPAGVFAACYFPALRWWIVLLYPLVVIRAQLPIGDAAIQLTTVVLLACLVAMRSQFALRRHPAPDATLRLCASASS